MNFDQTGNGNGSNRKIKKIKYSHQIKKIFKNYSLGHVCYTNSHTLRQLCFSVCLLQSCDFFYNIFSFCNFIVVVVIFVSLLLCVHKVFRIFNLTSTQQSFHILFGNKHSFMIFVYIMLYVPFVLLRMYRSFYVYGMSFPTKTYTS